ncbi:MAG: DUF5615 family PIN-like protein [Caldilineaceae bacterium]|nr:DUF5615 family PIN-like protein [Caldilineaceae bacterium]MDE0338057.1 DUF5615 family PIN-like protein [Caldilineaceae bacterium]
MSLALYMDHHVKGAVTGGLRHRGIDVLTASEDGASRLDDEMLLQRATELGRVLFSQDADLLRLAASFQRQGIEFTGLLYVHQLRLNIGQVVEDLEIAAKALDPEEIANRIEFLPL